MIRIAHLSDLDRIDEIYNEIHTEIEEGRAVIGWIRGVYPERTLAETSIRLREMYVLEAEGRIVACGRINRYQGPEYADAQWSFDADADSVLVLHTLVVSPKEKGRGYGRQFVAFYEDMARRMGCTALRIDTNALNKPARALYRKLNYTEACIIPTSFNGIDNVMLVCLDKKVQGETVSEILRRMTAYPGNTLHDIDHLVKVHAWARAIAQSENMDPRDREIAEIAAIVHDIACPQCREKYGSCIPEKQEQEGAVLAREFLAKSGLTPEAVDRICFLVGRHHTTKGVQGMDWQILLEADYIANAGESHFAPEDMQDFVSWVFRTRAGKQIMRDIYGV